MPAAITTNVKQTHSHFPCQHPLLNRCSHDVTFWGRPGPKSSCQMGKCHRVKNKTQSLWHGTQNAFPHESCCGAVRGLALRSSSHEFSYRKPHFSHAVNAWQHCSSSMLSPHVDTVTLVSRFGTGKSFPFAAHKTAPLLLSHLKGHDCFILQMNLTFISKHLIHLQDQVVTKLLVSSLNLRRRCRRRTRALQCRKLIQEDAAVQSISGPLCPPILPG